MAVSVESKLAHRRHVHLRDRAVMDHHHAVETQALRSRMDGDRADSDTRELRGRVLDAGEKTDRDERYAHERAGAVQKLMGKHDAKSTAADEAYAADLEKIRKSGPSAGQHVAKRAPERGDAHYEVWSSLDSARRHALNGVCEKFARQHNDADAEHFDLNKSNMQREDIRNAKTVRSRYGKPGTKTGADIQDRLEDRHFKLYEGEHAEIRHMVSRFEREIASALDREARHAAERRDVAARQSRESMGHR